MIGSSTERHHDVPLAIPRHQLPLALLREFKLDFDLVEFYFISK